MSCTVSLVGITTQFLGILTVCTMMISLECDNGCLQYFAFSKLSMFPELDLAQLKNALDFTSLTTNLVDNEDNVPMWFGSTLEALQKIEVTIPAKSNCSPKLYVPVPVLQLCQFLDQHLHAEGLFRVSGSVRRISELKRSLQEGHELQDENPHDVANILTLLFRQLKVNLFPMPFYDSIMSIMQMKDQDGLLQAVQLICLLLPRSHLNCLIYLCHFLKRVVDHSDANKMSTYNLAAVFAPNLLRLEVNLFAADKQEKYRLCLTKQAEFVQVLINNCDRIGSLPDLYATYSLCPEGNCCHKTLLEESVTKTDSKRRRSFADRLIMTMCSKLRTQSNTAGSDQAVVSVRKERRTKRGAEDEEVSCPAKRRSLQSSAVCSTDQLPTVTVTPYQFPENMDKPRINFVDGDTSTYSQVGKEQRHDSGSTSCFDLLPKVKPKKRRSLRNLLRSKIPADEAVVSYPVNPKEDEAAYSAIGQKLANHSCESLSDLPDVEKKASHKLLSRLKSPFKSPHVRRSRRRKARYSDVPYELQRSKKSLPTGPDALINVDRYSATSKSCETLESTLSNDSALSNAAELQAQPSSDKTGEQTGASPVSPKSGPYEKIISQSPGTLETHESSPYFNLRTDRNLAMSASLSAGLTVSLTPQSSNHARNEVEAPVIVHATPDPSFETSCLQIQSSHQANLSSTPPSSACNDVAERSSFERRSENGNVPSVVNDQLTAKSEEMVLVEASCRTEENVFHKATSPASTDVLRRGAHTTAISLRDEPNPDPFQVSTEGHPSSDFLHTISDCLSSDIDARSTTSSATDLTSILSEPISAREKGNALSRDEASSGSLNDAAGNTIVSEELDRSNTRSLDKELDAGCAAVLQDIIDRVCAEHAKSTGPCLIASSKSRIKGVQGAAAASPLRRSRVISRRSGSALLDECGIVRGETPLRRVRPSPSKKQQRLIKRVNSPAGPFFRSPAMSLATKSKLRRNLEGGIESLLLPNNLTTSFSDSAAGTPPRGVDDNVEKARNKLRPGVAALAGSESTSKQPAEPPSLNTRGSNRVSTSERIKQFETRAPVIQTAKVRSTRKSRAIKQGCVSETIRRFNGLTQNPVDGSAPVKLAPLPYNEAHPLPWDYKLSQYTRCRPKDDSDVTKRTPIVRRRKSKSLDGLGTPNREKHFESPLRTPAKLHLGPLVVRDLNVDDK